MQNEYAGDIGDLAKLLVLRTACGDDLSLGVVWYLTVREEVDRITAQNDGRHTKYASDASWRSAHPLEVGELAKLTLEGATRSLAALEGLEVWPLGTRFFSEPLSLATEKTFRARHYLRAQWHRRALAATNEADVVFLDPDNGVRTKDLTGRDGPKYAAAHEIADYIQRGQAVIVYAHRGRETMAQCVSRTRRHVGVAPSTAAALEAHGGRAFVAFGPEPRIRQIRDRFGRLRDSWSPKPWFID